jgi:hypothetical protein
LVNRDCGLVFEKYCIFLKAVESLTVELPISLKFIKLRTLVLSFGDKRRWAGVEVSFELFLF